MSKSNILHDFADFLSFMRSEGWSENYNPDESNFLDAPDSYPCVAVNNYFMDYDNRQRDHLHYVYLDDFWANDKSREIIKKKLADPEDPYREDW